MFISKFAGTRVASKIAELYTRFTGKSLYYTDSFSSLGGALGKTNFKTGTRVINIFEGERVDAKYITLGKGNSLRSELGITESFTVYPRGSFTGGEDGLIVYPADPQKMGWVYTLKEFSDQIKNLKKMKAEGVLTA